MESDFQSARPVRGFVRDFISLWDQRLSRLLDAVAAGKVDAAREVLLSIKASSVMLGASQLNSVAETIEVHLGNGRVLPALLDALADCGIRTIQRLTSEYLQPAS